MSFEALNTWKAGYDLLNRDLDGCTAHYSCSSRKFHIPSTQQFNSLSDLEDRIVTTFNQGKEALSGLGEEIHTRTQFLKQPSETINMLDCTCLQGMLKKLEEFYPLIFGNEFLSLGNKIIQINKTSDEQAQLSCLFRIFLWIRRFFTNLFKPTPETFRNNLAELQKNGFVDQLKMAMKDEAAFTQIVHWHYLHLRDTTDFAKKDEVKALFDQLMPIADNATLYYGIPFTTQEAAQLRQDEFFGVVKTQANEGNSSAMVFGVNDHFTQEELNEKYNEWRLKYPLFDDKEDPLVSSIRLKLMLVVQQLYHNLTQILQRRNNRSSD